VSAVALEGKVMVITGASSGIGAATAIECARAGMKIVANARRADRLDAVAEQVRAGGGEVETVVGDVAETGMSSRLLDAAQQRFGGFYAVFANAGYGFDAPVHETADERLRHIFEVNFFAASNLLNAAVARLLEQKRGGHLIMCSSCLAKFTLPGHGAYSAAKAAQNHLCRAMNIELERQGIRVSSVHPVTTATEFFQVSGQLSGRDVQGEGLPRHTPRLFVQPPQRVARAVVRCLRRPRPEVWTSVTTRAAAAAMTLFPRFMDVVMRRAGQVDEK